MVARGKAGGAGVGWLDAMAIVIAIAIAIAMYSVEYPYYFHGDSPHTEGT